MRTNIYGFRDTRDIPPKNGKAMLLGDSFTQGNYLSQEETIAGQLSQRWNSYVYNFGVGGYSTDQEFMIAREALDVYSVEYVILLAFSNDLPYFEAEHAWGLNKPHFAISNANKDDGTLDLDRIVPAPGVNFSPKIFSNKDTPEDIRVLSQSSYIDSFWSSFTKAVSDDFDMLFKLIKNPAKVLSERQFLANPQLAYLELTGLKGAGQAAYTDVTFLKREWYQFFQLVSKLQELSNAKQAKLIVLLIPERGQIESLPQVEFQAVQQGFLDGCARSKITCIEPISHFQSKNRLFDLYFRDDPHLNKYGDELTAELLDNFVTNNGCTNMPKGVRCLDGK